MFHSTYLPNIQVWEKIRGTSADLERILKQGSNLYVKAKGIDNKDIELQELLEKLGQLCEDGKETEVWCWSAVT